MFLSGIGTATPSRRYTKTECWQAFVNSACYARLDARARRVLERVLHQDNGIHTRHLALDSLADAFEIDPDTLHRRFLAHAPALVSTAAKRALDDAGLTADDIDAIVVSTCTGYLCPGLSGYVAEALGLRSDVKTYDLVGQGCAAALPNWQLCEGLLATERCRHTLSVCVEVCSAAMYIDNDPGVIISACLFGDGAGAAVLSAAPPAGKRRIEWRESASFIDPGERDALRFEQCHGMLRNVLTRRVPQLAADYARRVLDGVLQQAGLTPADINAWIMHAGGRDVLHALEQALGIERRELRYSAAMLHDHGNLSSAFVYFVLQAALADEAADGWWWMSSFGAGFSCHGALLKVG